MIDVKKIFICPKCRSELPDDLKCPSCGKQYTYAQGVYNLISTDLSGEQEYLYRNELRDISEALRLFFPNGKEENPDWEKRDNDDYYSYYSSETTAAMKKQDEYIRERLRSFSGNVCDLATGGGTMLQKILDSGNDALSIVCTDINELELAVTRVRRNSSHTNISYIATDGRYLSLKEGSFDYITSLVGFGNIPEGDKVAKELYRILKSGGKIIIQGSYIEKDSKSYVLAQSVGIERGMVEEYLIHDLKSAGFENVKSTVVAEAIWTENPYDLIPVAGDTQYFGIIEAEKPE